MDAQAARWKEELDTRIQSARVAARRPLSSATLASLRSQFWSRVDEQLDKAEAEARQRLRR